MRSLNIFKISIIAIILLIFTSAALYLISKNIKMSRYEKVADDIVSYFRKEIETQKSNALSLAIVLAENEALKEAMIDDDEDKGYEILSSAISQLQKYTFTKDIRAQAIAKDLTIFARSWDQSFAGMPLEGFRADLSRIKKIKKPKVSIETGRLLTIKATTPIKKGAKILGYLEIIGFFEPLTEHLRDKGIETFVLMDAKFLNIATLMRENPIIDNYVVSNRNYNLNILLKMKKLDFEKLKLQKTVYQNGYFYIYEPMLNGVGEKIGAFVLVLPKEVLEKFSNSGDISFFIQFNERDFYNIVNIWENPKGQYKSVYEKELINLLPSLPFEEQKDVEIELRELLRNYSKDELINIILKEAKKEKKSGVIK
ncbi:hypothetical protein [Nitrosophilus kaiyonis]|uniref:hypothetical protein n=1 Tax=Nitrosophilus kaiyonis TaxID=2930200 RepID=UPI0024937CF8|nr:hypothetical protein [Nitrosophilus kaiyonis]